MSIAIKERKPVSAVFVDVENMSVDREVGIVDFDIDRVMARIGELSRPIVRKAYADWFRLRRYRDAFLRAGFDQVQTTYINRSKNGLDMQMCVDAMEVTLLTREIEVIFLVTADSDFAALARALRRHGRHVYAIGWSEKSNEIFRVHCDEFIAYEELAGPPTAEEAPPAGRPRAGPRAAPARGPAASIAASRPRGAAPSARGGSGEARGGARPLADLDRAIALTVARYGAGQTITARQFSSAMRAAVPGFDPRRFGYPTLTALVHAHPLLSRDAQSPGTSLSILLPRRIDLAVLLAEDAIAPEAAERQLAEEPVRFLGREGQYAVLDALHEAYLSEDDGFRRSDVIAQAKERLPDLKAEDIERVDRLVWDAHVFQVEDRKDERDALRWTVRLSARYQDIEALRFEHDKRLLADAMAAGIVLRARDWARVLDGDEVEVADFADILLELGFVDPELSEDDDQGAATSDAAPTTGDAAAASGDAGAPESAVNAGNGFADDHGDPEEGERNDVSFGFTGLLGEEVAASAETDGQSSVGVDAGDTATGHRALRPSHVPQSPRLKRSYES